MQRVSDLMVSDGIGGACASGKGRAMVQWEERGCDIGYRRSIAGEKDTTTPTRRLIETVSTFRALRKTFDFFWPRILGASFSRFLLLHALPNDAELFLTQGQEQDPWRGRSSDATRSPRVEKRDTGGSSRVHATMCIGFTRR